MKTETRKSITYYMPGTFFSEQSSKRVDSFAIPASIPKDCYGFSFSECEWVIDGKKEFMGKTREDGKMHLVGKVVPWSKLPKGADHAILRANIENNSPTKEAIQTHLGTWQMVRNNTVVHSPDKFKFTKPLIWKNIKTLTEQEAE